MMKSSLMQRLFMQPKDLAYLKHMLDSSQAILSFTSGRSQNDLDMDRQLFSALIRELEIIGEAANHVSQDLQSKLLQIPWQKISFMRNRLLHTYFATNKTIVWNTIQDIVPNFCLTLEKIIEGLEN